MLKLELRNKIFLLDNLTGLFGSEVLEIYYTLLFLIKDYSKLPAGGYYTYLIGTREEPTFIRLELPQDEFLIDVGIDDNGTRTHKIVMQSGTQIQAPGPNIRLICFDVLLKRILINGEESECINEYYSNYSGDVELLNIINTLLKPYFPKYNLISYNLIFHDDADNFVTRPLDTTELEYQISVKLLRACYISRYVFSSKYEQCIIVFWHNIIPFDNIRFSIFNVLFEAIQKLGVYLIFNEEERYEFNKHDPNMYW